MPAPFDAALVDAVSFLRELPRERDGDVVAGTELQCFREAHPGVRADLLIDRPPGSPRVDYDLLLGVPDGSTVAVTWRRDDGVPWTVEYADHWAANAVVTVNGWQTSIQKALTFLKMWADRNPDLMADLVDQSLVAQAIGEDPPPVSALEILAAADQFRWANGLQSDEAISRWLQETGLSITRFEGLICQLIQRRKFERRLTEDRVEPYFEAHRTEFDIVRFVRVETSDQDLAERLAHAAVQQGLLASVGALTSDAQDPDLHASLNSRHVRDLPADLAGASHGAVLAGPVAGRPLHWVAQVLNRYPARLDERTRTAIEKDLLQRWFTERREQATVRWHWV